MRSLLTWTLSILTLVALAGLFLRSMPFLPETGISFTSLRHAHSHLGFLGWVFGAYYLLLVHFLAGPGQIEQPRHRRLFYATQGVALAMFVAFAAQGYGAISIALLTLHTVLAFMFFYRLYRDVRTERASIAWLFGMTALAAFVLSALGPFAIPLVQRFAPDDPLGVRMAVHFYLHFHYDGWFVFGLMAVLYRILEQEGIPFSRTLARWQWRLLAVALAPAYFLHAPRALLPEWLNLVIALLYCGGAALFVLQVRWFRTRLLDGAPPAQRLLLYLALGALLVKYALDLLSALPPLVEIFGRGNHFLVLGYLHLLFLGAVTPFVWWVLLRMGWIARPSGSRLWLAISLFSAGFVVSELLLFGLGLGVPVPNSGEALLGATVLLAAGVLLLPRR